MSFIKARITASAKKMLPLWLVQYLRQSRQFGPRERAVYRRLRLRRALGMSHYGERRAPAGARTLIFICYGNVMRSPMAAALARQMLASQMGGDFHVMSAGLHADFDKGADPRSLRIAREFSVSLEPHRTTLLTRKMVAAADAIFAMDLRNQVEFLAVYPSAQDKLFMLGTYAEPSLDEIPDPYMGDEEQLRHCYRTLQICVSNLVADLTRKQCLRQPTDNTVEV